MKRQKLLNKRILALALSAAMVFAQADTYAVLAAAPENQEEAVEYDESQSVLTEYLEAEELGTEGTESETESDSDEAEGSDFGDTSDQVEPDTEDIANSGTADSDTVGDADSENGGAESPDDAKETEKAELPEEPSVEEASEGEQENNIAEVNEDEAENPEETVNSGTINDISWSIDADGLLTIEGTGDYVSGSVAFDYLPPWAGRNDVKSAKVDVSGITRTDSMFRDCVNLSSVDLSGLKTDNVKSMCRMFESCSSLTSLDVSGFNTGNVWNMGRMFHSCSSLSSLDVSGFDTRSVGYMYNMFWECSSLTSLDVSKFDTGKVIDMVGMFGRCSNLTSLDVSKFDTSNVTDMHSMFSSCSNLDILDVSGFDTGNVTDMGSMFLGCSSLSSIDVSGFDTENVTNMHNMFTDCSGLNSLEVSSFDTRNVTDMGYLFSGCSKLTILNVSGFDTKNVTNMGGMFYGCSGVSSLDVSGFDTRNVTDVHAMFYYCSSLINLDVSGFSTGNVIDMGEMFRGCNGLISLDVSNFLTSNVTDMGLMFASCSGLSSLDLSSFDMQMVVDEHNSMPAMLSGCDSLTYICTPKTLALSVTLPISNAESDKWYDESGNEYTELPTNSSRSIVLYKNGYPGDESGTKKVVFISGITIEGKTYDGTPISYTGTPVVKDSSGNTITGIMLTASYTGTLADGSKYEQNTQPPSQAGNYTLSFAPSGGNSYTFSQTSYPFSIKPAVLTITAPSASIKASEALPVLSSLTTTAEGLLEGDALTVQPQLKYGTDNIQTNAAGTYDIIPYGADAGNNYSINYVNGTLTITASGETPGDDPNKDPDKEPEIVHKGSSKNNKLTWTIDDTGKLTVKGTGNYPTINDEDYGTMPAWFPWAETITSAEINVSGITTTSDMFRDCINLKIIDLTNLNTSKVTDMGSMFNGCNALETLDVSGFNTSKVKYMGFMFDGCSTLETLDVSGFNTSNVTNMADMFVGCSSLESLDVSSFNTSKVKYMSEMFMNCESLEDLDVSSFNTSNVVRINEMFWGCSGLTSLDLRNFNTSKVVAMYDMFANCENLESLDISSFNTKNVGTMSGMFSYCSNLKRLDLSNFDTSNVSDMMYMFEGCSSLTDLNLSSFNTKNVLDIDHMFYGCSSLTSLDLSSCDLSNLGNYEDYDDEDEYYAQVYDYVYDPEVFTGCNNLSYIRTPKNCLEEIKLPAGATGTDKWYQALNTQCTTLPTGQSTSIELYKNGYPGDGTTKKAAFISGISVNNMVYNGRNAGYLGTAVVTDTDGNKITDATLTYSYIGELADESDYKETTQAPSEAGNYKLLIKAESNDYSGQASYGFRIDPKTVVVRADSVSIETGAALPALTDLSYIVSGLVGDDKLTVEPKLTYSESNISTASARRCGIVPSGASAGNNYSIEYEEGTLTIGDPDDDSSFEMDERNALDLSALSCTIAPVKAKIYDGSAYEPTVKVTVTENGKKKTLAEGTDYRVLYEGNINAGTGKVIVRGSGIYKGYKEAPITITPKAVKKLKVVTGGVAGTISADDVNNGSTSLPVYVYDAGKLLTRGKDYTLTYDSVKNGTLTVKVKGMDGSNYTGENTAKVTVYEGASADHIINPDNVILKSYTEKYTGKAIKPVVEVNINGEIVSNKNYKVQYQNNKSAGTAYVIVTGKGAYKGKVVTTFEITANTQSLHITNIIKAQTYNGKLLKPSVTVTAGNKKLKKNTDYVVTYKNNLHAGTATVTVTGKGNYTGTVTKTFTINPLKASKITVKGTWKDTNADGVKDGGALTVTYGKRLLKEGVDYTLEAGETKNNKITVTFKGAEGSDFTGSVVKTLKME